MLVGRGQVVEVSREEGRNLRRLIRAAMDGNDFVAQRFRRRVVEKGRIGKDRIGLNVNKKQQLKECGFEGLE